MNRLYILCYSPHIEAKLYIQCCCGVIRGCMKICHFAEHFLNRMQSATNSAGTDDGDESSFRTRDIYILPVAYFGN